MVQYYRSTYPVQLLTGLRLELATPRDLCRGGWMPSWLEFLFVCISTDRWPFRLSQQPGPTARNRIFVTSGAGLHSVTHFNHPAQPLPAEGAVTCPRCCRSADTVDSHLLEMILVSDFELCLAQSGSRTPNSTLRWPSTRFSPCSICQLRHQTCSSSLWPQLWTQGRYIEFKCAINR